MNKKIYIYILIAVVLIILASIYVDQNTKIHIMNSVPVQNAPVQNQNQAVNQNQNPNRTIYMKLPMHYDDFSPVGVVKLKVGFQPDPIAVFRGVGRSQMGRFVTIRRVGLVERSSFGAIRRVG